MRIENYFDFSGNRSFSGLFSAVGSFGVLDGRAEYLKTEKNGNTVYIFHNDSVKVCAEFEIKDGICIRRDSLENISDHTVEINHLVSRFCLDGDDYDIYTQYSSWQHESDGKWQRLVTQIRAQACSMLGCDGATPIMGFHNRYTGKNTVFHLIPNAQWQMTARKVPLSAKEIVVFEAGLCDTGLRFSLSAGEKIDLPELIFFSAESKIDLDAYKLHRYFNKAYPRRKTPVVFNSWLYCFDKIDIDALIKQADIAAQMGFEAFMIDAGWFGKGAGWYSSVGDWEENTVSGPQGRLIELARHVRGLGMIFGLWFEPERASEKSQAVAEHPEFYIENRFLDFSNPAAIKYMLDVISQQIEKYGIGWVKFDFNSSIPYDLSGCAFYRYLKGQRHFVEEIRNRFPDLYITNCAGGGYRMDLYQAQAADSFWLSDNQGPLGGIEIVKGTLKRMPSALIERWNVQKYATGFPRYGHDGDVGVLFNCNNGTWDSIVSVDPSFAEGFVIGGPIGFSCDLDFPSEYKNRWGNVISDYKSEREFYQSCEARILVDSEPITVIEYTTGSFDRIVIQVFSKTVYAKDLILYPVVNESAYYTYDGDVVSGKDIAENGIYVRDIKDNSCRILKLQIK